MASLLDTISEDASMALQMAQQGMDSRTLELVVGEPPTSGLDAGRDHEGFVASRKMIVFGDATVSDPEDDCREGKESREAPDPAYGPVPKNIVSGDVIPTATADASATDMAEYRLIGKLGSGGTAVVYQAHQRAIDREVAIKMLRPELATESSSRLRFLTEARVIGSLDHPNVIALHDLCVDEQGQLFYSMKRIDGTSWDHQIADRSVEENLTILLRVADAIRYAHSRGLVHRDLKPENVMLGRFGEALVADWGLAVRVGESRRQANQPSDQSPEPAKTKSPRRFPGILGASTAIGGTPAYMAPEQALGDIAAIDERTDVYLLGGILYQILTGKPPHHGQNLLECVHAAANNSIQPTEVKGELVEASLKAMATDPNDRFPSVDELVMAITDHRTHQESERLVRRATRRVWPSEPTEASGDVYERFRVGEALLHEALALWPENRVASQTLVRAQLEFARFASAQGDLDLSLRLFEAAGEQDSEAANRVRRDLERRERVRESQAKYSALFTQSPEAGLLIRWSDGTVMEANQSCMNLLKYEKEELVGRAISDLSIWACSDRRKQFVGQLTRDGQVDNFDTQFVQKNAFADCESDAQMDAGSDLPGVIDVLISARTVEVGGVEMILSTIRDISQRRKAERNLEQSRRRLRDLQRMAGLGTWSFDPNADTVSWSEEAFRLCGRDPDKGEPSFEEFRDLIHPDDRVMVSDAIQRAIDSGASYQLNYRLRDDQGNYRRLTARGRPVSDAGGNTIEVYGILQMAPTLHPLPQKSS